MTDRSGILVVDDSPETLKLLSGMLLGEGYRVRPANSGELALASIMAEPPELVLLDIRMPGIDGFEVCRRLKARAESRDIPVVFISVATEVEERVEGFALGAVDFVSKPFQREELLARVRTHLELSRLRTRLEAIVKERTVELTVANEALRKAHEALENWVEERERLAMDLHDGVIQSLYAVMLGMSTQDRLLDDRAVDLRASLRQAKTQISKAIRELRHYVSDLRPHNIEVGGLRSGLEAVVADFRINSLTPPELELVGDVDCVLGADAMSNLLYIVREATSNALRHASSRSVKVRLEQTGGHIMLTILDNGKGFDAATLPGKPGKGLRNMAERAAMLGGLLMIDSKINQGTEVSLALPVDTGTAVSRYLSRGTV